MAATIAVVLGAASLPFTAAASQIAGDAKTALILYDHQEELHLYAKPHKPVGGPPTDFGLAYGRQLQTLLGHFSLSAITLQPVQAYRPGGLEKHTVSFIIGSPTRSRIPTALLDDVSRTRNTVVWLSGGIDRFAARIDLPSRYGFRLIGRDHAIYRWVFYKGIRLDKGEPETFSVQVTDPSRVVVHATAVGDRRTVPYVLRSGRLWFVADNPLAYTNSTDRYLAFADLIHDMVGEEHTHRRYALIRIEDVSPLSRPEQLRTVADLLFARAIPFVVSVIPFHVEPVTQTHVSLSERPRLAAALRYMAARGGTIAVHGSTHQYRGETGDDYEFWDAVYRRPIQGETEDYVAQRVEDAVAELLRNDLYPMLWETPHYAASRLAYSVVARYFTSVFEQRQALDDQRTSFFLPYLIRRDIYGQQVVPENLGFVAKEGESPEPILQAARAHLVVRDAIAGAFFHPFIRLGALREIVEGLQGLGYTFLDVRLLDHEVHTPEGFVATGNVRAALRADGRNLQEFIVDRRGRASNHRAVASPPVGLVRRSFRVPAGSIYVARTSVVWGDRRGGSGTPRLGIVWRRVSQSLLARQSRPVEEARAAILWDAEATGALAREQRALRAALAAAGIKASAVPVADSRGSDLAAFNLILVPQSAARLLPQETTAAIVAANRGGARVITTGRSALSEALGIRFSGRSVRVKVVRDRLVPTLPITWRFPGDLAEFAAPPGAETVVTEQGTGRPVAVIGPLAQGAYFYLGSLFSAGPGYDRFPFAVHHVFDDLRIRTTVRSEGLEVFFDPGFRQNVSIERLALDWRRQGVRVVHAAAWAFYPRYVFDYPRLIRSAHANGILVYAWFALPHLTESFWVRHPECREKDYAGRDARGDWRFLLALTDESCRAEVGRIVRDILMRYDWDGANLTEIYFEGAAGFEDPRPLTPFHPSAREDFRRRHGFDPRKIFDPASPYFWKRDPRGLDLFHEFRLAWIVRLHDWALRLADQARASRRGGLEVVVTAIDSLSVPVLRDSIAVDMHRILALRKNHDFALAVEDPAPMWVKPPERYARIAHLYRSLLPEDGKLLIDINILPFRPDFPHDYPIEQQGGLEVLQMVASAAEARRVLLYAESTLLEPDRRLVPYALATVARKERQGAGWRISTPTTVVVEADGGEREVFVNGRPWPGFVRGRVLLPPGTHDLSFRRGAFYVPRLRAQSLKLQKVSAPQWRAKVVRDGLEVRYSSPARTILIVTRAPDEVLVDGNVYTTVPRPGDDGYAVTLPAGTHTAHLRSVETFTRPLDFAGYLVALAIRSIGTIGISILLLIAVPRFLSHRNGMARR